MNNEGALHFHMMIKHHDGGPHLVGDAHMSTSQTSPSLGIMARR